MKEMKEIEFKGNCSALPYRDNEKKNRPWDSKTVISEVTFEL